MAKKKAGFFRRAFRLFFVLFIQSAVAFVAVLYWPMPSSHPTSVPAAQAVVTTTVSGMVSVYGQPGSVVLAADDGTSRTCTLPDKASRITRATANGVEFQTSAGQPGLLSFDCTATSSTVAAGLPNPSGSRRAQLGTPRADGAGVIDIPDGVSRQEIVLRDSASHPYHDAQVIGWMDDANLAVTAYQGDAIYALGIGMAGQVKQLVALPEAVGDMRAGSEWFWYVTAMPGQGIELGPSGPSDLHRVGVDGKDHVVAHVADVMDGLAVAPTGQQFAYRSNGAVNLGQGMDVKNVGTGLPVGWGADGTLLVLRQGRLVAIPAEGPVTETDVLVPDGVSQAWRVKLDAVPHGQ